MKGISTHEVTDINKSTGNRQKNKLTECIATTGYIFF